MTAPKFPAVGQFTGTQRSNWYTKLYAQTKSPVVQRAIAEVFLRAGPREVASPERIALLRAHRLPVRGGPDLVDVLLNRLQGI